MVQSKHDLVINRFKKDAIFSLGVLAGFIEEDELRSLVETAIDDVYNSDSDDSKH